MKLLCLLFVVGVVTGSDTGYGAPSLYELQELVDTVEKDMQGVAAKISDATTLSAVIDDEILEINDFSIAAVNNKNAQQNELIASYKAQVKGLQDKVDAAAAKEKEASSLAQATLASVTDQIDNYVNGSQVKGVNAAHDAAIAALQAAFVKARQDYLAALKAVIAGLNAAEAQVRGKIGVLNDFVAKRKCEYGSGFLAEGVTTIKFKTKFDVPPTVCVAVNGFAAHLDNYKKHYDILSFKKEVKAQSTEAVTLATFDKSDGQVDVTYISCSWMACQFLDREVNLHP